MTIEQILAATTVWAVLCAVVFTHCNWGKIRECFGMWFTKEYWKPYNVVEALSWCAKAIIIVPGLVFGIQIQWLYFFAAATSLTLIWASNEKLLPTLVGFNTIWVWLAVAVIVQNLIN